MLDIPAWPKRWWPYATFAIGLVLILTFSTWAPSYEDCSANHHKQYTDPEKGKPPPEVLRTFSESAMVFAECEGEFVHANEGVILAVSTIFLALFTLALWRSTDALWEAGEKQFKLATDQFKATHRPEIIIHSLTPIHEGKPEEKIAVIVTYVNKGRGKARILHEKGRMTQRTLPLPSGWPEQVRNTPGVWLASGERKTYLVDSSLSLTAYKKIPRFERKTNIEILCNGGVFYEDEVGVRRETGFLRRLNADGDMERWEKVEDHEEYEFAY